MIVRFRGIDVNVETRQPGVCAVGTPALVLIHGFGASLRTWDRVAPALAETHPVVAMDLKGFGLSGRPRDGRYAIDDNADLVLDLLRELRLDRVVLIGHSYGGAVALTVAARMRVQGLVLIDAASYQQRLPFFVEAMRNVFTRWLSALTSVDRSSRMVLRSLFVDKSLVDDEMVERYAGPRRRAGSHYAAVQTALQILPESFEAVTRLIRSIDVPTQIIWGDRDNAVAVAFAHRLHRDIRGSSLHVLPGVGHMPHEERPGDVRRLIEEFVQRVQEVQGVQRSQEVHHAKTD